MMKALFTLLLTLYIIQFSTSIYLDIHLPLVANTSSCIYHLVEKTNENLNRWSSSQQTNEQIHFPNFANKDSLANSTQIPHITLFLTEFSVENNEQVEEEEEEEENAMRKSPDMNITILNELIEKTNDAICQAVDELYSSRYTTSSNTSSSSSTSHSVMYSYYNAKLLQPFLSGPYAMYHVLLDDQIQILSNKIVEYTQPFVKRNQSIPTWVDNIIDEKVKLKKIKFIKKYGSPNVFDEFDPHVTVGYDDYNGSKSKEKDEERNQILDEMDWEQCNGWIDQVRIGLVGNYGTVVGGPLATIDFGSCFKNSRFVPIVSSSIQ